MTKADKTKTVIVGKIGAPYGVQGWVKVHSYTEPQENLFAYPLLLESRHAGWQPVAIEQFKEHGSAFVAKLQNVVDRDQAALITNATLAVYRDDLPELDPEVDAGRYYWADLVGLTVYNQANVNLGQVQGFFASGANDILVVQSETGEHLIPYVPDLYVIAVDLDAGRILVNWDEEI